VVNIYTFAMEKILELREIKEKNVMEEFALSQNELLHQELILTRLNNQYESAKEKGLEVMDIYELRQHDLYKHSLEDRIEKQEELIKLQNDELEKIRLDLVDAQKERKIMENLKEKDFDTYKENVKSLEQKELDEMAILRFNKA
jgi:flagellar FliJ protein